MDDAQIFGEIDLANPIDWRHPLNRGRIGWWMGLPGASSGGRMLDLCGRSHGTLANMTSPASGWRGTTRPGGFGHVQYDGVDDYASGTGVTAGGLMAATIAVWFSTTTAQGTKYLFSLPRDTAASNGFDLAVTATAVVAHLVNIASTLATASCTVTYSDGKWHRLVATFDGATLQLYLDGAPVASASLAGPIAVPSNPTAGEWDLGRFGSAGAYFAGALDDAALWNRCLPAADVAADYGLGPRGYPGVLRRWPGIGPALMASTSFLPALPWMVGDDGASLGWMET